MAQLKARIMVPRVLGRVHTALYRLTGGLVGGQILGRPILLLTTTGLRTRKRRTVPLLYVPNGEAPVVIASSGGSARHPAWYTNLQADPACEVQIGRRRQRMRAATLPPGEREVFWAEAVAMFGTYEDYQKRTLRQIPVVRLEPVI